VPAGGRFRSRDSVSALRVAVIDGPFDAAALSGVLAKMPIGRGDQSCGATPNRACSHGTFVMGLLGARGSAPIAGLCPNCELLHVPLFVDEDSPQASVGDLARAISLAVRGGARLINLSLAILGDDGKHHGQLTKALDDAEARGSVVVVAAGNQGRLAMGQILSHPVAIPVVAVDAAGALLPESNFGPSISRRGVAAFGHEVHGYAPGGEFTTMSGTSVATAVATGVLAQAWMAHPEMDGREIRVAIARLMPRGGVIPPLITRDALLAALDRNRAPMTDAQAFTQHKKPVSYVKLQGETMMNEDNTPQRTFNRNSGLAGLSGSMVGPAQAVGGCACGGAPGACACGDGLRWPNCANAPSSESNFVYVLGTVDVCVPDQSIADELQRIGDTIGVIQGENPYTLEGDKKIAKPYTFEYIEYDIDPKEDLRSWCYRILTHEPHARELRYIARQLKWVLRVEGMPAYYLCLTDSNDFDDLIKLLCEPKPQRLLHADSQGAHSSSKSKPKPNWPHLETEREGHDLCLFVGTSSLVPTETCPGVTAPILSVAYMRAFEEKELSSWIETSSGKAPKPTTKPRAFSTSGQHKPVDFFRRIVQSADNYGDTDEWRALNYLAVQYKQLYRCYADMLEDNYALDSISVRRSRLWGNKRVVDPVFAFRSKDGVVEKYFVRVDVTHLFPTIVNHLSEYFDR